MTDRKTYIWGAAKYGKRALDFCEKKFNIVGFVDKRADDNFKEFCSFPVISPSQFFSMGSEFDLIIAIMYPAEILDVVSGLSNVYIFDGRNSDDLLLYEVKNHEISCPEYSDKRYKEWEPYHEHYNNQDPSILNIFSTALEYIKKMPTPKIIEIGCGSGLFANMLFDNGFEDYLGIDFSPEAIRLAQTACPCYSDKFICCDAFEYLELCSQNDKAIYALFEVLEHIYKDIELVNMLPSGSNIIFSVPNFKSFNHVRTFDNLQQITDRYYMLNINQYYKIHGERSDIIYHLINATKV